MGPGVRWQSGAHDADERLRRKRFYLAFSPDSKTIAALRGARTRQAQAGPDRRRRAAPARGRQRLLQRLQLLPERRPNSSTRRRDSERFPPRSDVFRSVPIPRRATAGARLTSDHRSRRIRSGARPGRSSSSSMLDANKRKYGPKNELYLMNPQGKAGQAPDPHRGRPAAAGPLPDRLVGERQAPARPSSRARTPATRSSVNPETGAPAAAWHKAGRAGLRRHRALRPTARPSSASAAASNRVQASNVATVPYAGGKLEDAGRASAFEPDWEPLSTRTGLVEQADLAQDRDAVGVDVLALDQAVLEGDHVEAVPLDPAARSARRRGRRGASVLAWVAARCPFLHDEPLADVEAAGGEGDVGPGVEDRADVVADRPRRSADSPAVWLSKTMSGACIAMIASRSWAFQAAL